MPLPLIPALLGGASLLAGAFGVKKGLDAKENFDRAERIGKDAQRKYDEAVSLTKSSQAKTKEVFAELGMLRKNVCLNELKSFIEKASDERLHRISKGKLEEMKDAVAKSMDFEAKAGGLASGVASGILAGFGASGSVGLLATASTGTAISSLAGAAATNATLAWLGGGALATGGLGMAGGTAVLGGLVAGPALAVGGFMLANKAEEALEKAEEYRSIANEAVSKLNRIKMILTGEIQPRVKKAINTTNTLIKIYHSNPNDENAERLFDIVCLPLIKGYDSDGVPLLAPDIDRLDEFLR